MLSKDQRRALLYVAARFMMVKIDRCAKRRRASRKPQASSVEEQALKRREGHRRKRASAQAMVRKLPDRGAWTKYNASLIVGLDYDPCIGRMFHVERNLVW